MNEQELKQQIDELKGQLFAYRTLTALMFAEIAKLKGQSEADLDKICKAMIASTDSWSPSPQRDACRAELVDVFETSLFALKP
ncbi:hypothetical protein [Paraburkholderia sp. D1E]|uniref:hypothetical protein n=1 Tax=Paraburkholderia sp. D1E TaxID=3461398 RepID=UPI004045484A